MSLDDVRLVKWIHELDSVRLNMILIHVYYVIDSQYDHLLLYLSTGLILIVLFMWLFICFRTTSDIQRYEIQTD